MSGVFAEPFSAPLRRGLGWVAEKAPGVATSGATTSAPARTRHGGGVGCSHPLRSSVQLDIVGTTGLGDRSHLVGADGVGVVIDPQPDIDRVVDRAADRGVQVLRCRRV